MRIVILVLFLMSVAYSQPPIEPGVSHDLAKWRAAHYSDVRYKLNLTLEKMSPVLKGTIEIRVNVRDAANGGRGDAVIVLDWRKIKGHEDKSTISNLSINGRALSPAFTRPTTATPSAAGNEGPPEGGTQSEYEESDEHLIFRNGVVVGENVIKLDFTSPILTSGSAITRYVDKADGSEYIYSLFVPSDASTAFPVFDQPDLKATFYLEADVPKDWKVVSNARTMFSAAKVIGYSGHDKYKHPPIPPGLYRYSFLPTKPISTYVFAVAAGPFHLFGEVSDFPGMVRSEDEPEPKEGEGDYYERIRPRIYVRKSQQAKFTPHAAEVFRLNREGIKFLETYFGYKFPFPKYDIVLIPEFPFGGMEHAGATFLREAAVIFQQEPTKNDYISRANVIFHEAAHQWFGDTVTMKWFDDLWLKEGFAEFMAYKTLEKVMPEYNAWKVFYERNKQAAYLTDSTKGTTPIYQEISNLNSAKSAYGNIVYRKAPSFLKQAEFYIGADKFQTAVRAFLKKHSFANAGWEDLVKEFETASGNNLREWAGVWVKHGGLPTFRLCIGDYSRSAKYTSHPGEIRLLFSQSSIPCSSSSYGRDNQPIWPEALQFYYGLADGSHRTEKVVLGRNDREIEEIWGYGFGGRESKKTKKNLEAPKFVFTNYGDYGYGIFLLDDKSRGYVRKNIQNEKDDFLRSMMWGSLWDSVREGELDPMEYVELAIKNVGVEKDESTIQTILARVSTAMTYYRPEPRAVATGSANLGLRNADFGSQAAVTANPQPQIPNPQSGRPVATAEGSDLSMRLESMLIDKMRNAPTLGQRITYYRALLNTASTEKARSVLKEMLRQKSVPTAVAGGSPRSAKSRRGNPVATAPGSDLPLKTKDRFDIVTKLASLRDPDAASLLSELEKTETTDDAKRYAYAARAAFPTKETKEKYWNDFTTNKDISESWIEAAFGPFNSVRHADLTLPYLERALKELPNHKRNRKIFFVNGWLAAFIGGQRSEEALNIVNKFLADNPDLDRDLRLKILENVDLIERAVKIRAKFATR